jgi:hypothetical protein
VRAKAIVRKVRSALLAEMLARGAKHALHAALCAWHAAAARGPDPIVVVERFVTDILDRVPSVRQAVRDFVAAHFTGCLSTEEKPSSCVFCCISLSSESLISRCSVDLFELINVPHLILRLAELCCFSVADSGEEELLARGSLPEGVLRFRLSVKSVRVVSVHEPSNFDNRCVCGFRYEKSAWLTCSSVIEAESALTKDLELRAKSFGDHSRYTAEAVLRLSRFRLSQQQGEQATELLRQPLRHRHDFSPVREAAGFGRIRT